MPWICGLGVWWKSHFHHVKPTQEVHISWENGGTQCEFRNGASMQGPLWVLLCAHSKLIQKAITGLEMVLWETAGCVSLIDFCHCRLSFKRVNNKMHLKRYKSSVTTFQSQLEEDAGCSLRWWTWPWFPGTVSARTCGIVVLELLLYHDVKWISLIPGFPETGALRTDCRPTLAALSELPEGQPANLECF